MLLILSLLIPTAIFIGCIHFSLIYISKYKVRKALSKLPQPIGKLPLLGHTLLLVKKGVDITESSFGAFYKYAVEFRENGLFALDLPFQPVVHIFSPEHFEKMMTSKVHINKATMYNTLLPWLGTGLIVSGGEKWHKDRKTLTPAFHLKINDEFNPTMNKHARILCESIRTSLDLEVTDCVATISACALDTICETSMGVAMKTQPSDYEASFLEFNRLAVRRILNPLVLSSDFLYAITPNGWKSKRMIKNMHDFTGSIVRQRKKETELAMTTTKAATDGHQEKRKCKSLLDLMLEIHLNDHSLSLEDIKFQLDNFAFAGHDTVSFAVTFVLLCLANHTDIQHRVRAELLEVLGNQECEIRSEHLPKFLYLEMVIKETLRLYTPLPFSARHLYENFTLGDYFIPKGTDVYMSHYALHRNPIYWPEPERFDPERFSAENSIGRHPFSFLPFSAGPRNCIGQRYAKSFIKIFVAVIVAQFEIIPITKLEDVRLSVEVTMKTMQPIQMKFNPLKV